MKSVFSEMPLDGVIEQFPPVGGLAVEKSKAFIPLKPSVIVMNSARRYLFPPVREPPLITMSLEFSGVLVIRRKSCFLCQVKEVFRLNFR